jgi:hypothetical protein
MATQDGRAAQGRRRKSRQRKGRRSSADAKPVPRCQSSPGQRVSPSRKCSPAPLRLGPTRERNKVLPLPHGEGGEGIAISLWYLNADINVLTPVLHYIIPEPAATGPVGRITIPIETSCPVLRWSNYTG